MMQFPTIILDPTKKHDIVWLFDVTNGNPNGDPDADNMPREDYETSHGYVTDVCLKRKIRNYAEMRDQMIFVRDGSVLNEAIGEAVKQVGGTKAKPKPSEAAAVMCQRFYDVRMFGAVMSTGENAGQVRGACQVSFATSINPIAAQSITVTRCAATDAKEGKGNKTMGRKTFIPYGLYRSHVFFNPALAKKSGVSSADLELFYAAMLDCFEFDRSAARGEMATRGLWVFSHDSQWGNAPAHVLFGSLGCVKSEGVEVPRSFADYELSEPGGMMEGVTLSRLR
jgi:CRISPR-associated protein Csd2